MTWADRVEEGFVRAARFQAGAKVDTYGEEYEEWGEAETIGEVQS
jgi:hypothetical protein